MKKCLIFLEKNYEKDGIDLLGAVQELYGNSFKSTAVTVDADAHVAKGRVNELVRIPEEAAADFDVRVLAFILRKLHAEKTFDCILIAATPFGRQLAPYTAALLDCGLVADVTEVRRIEERAEMVRPAFGGRMMAVVEKTGDGAVMMSVRPGVFSFTPSQETETLESVFPVGNLPESRMILLRRQEKPQRKDIRDSEVLVSGGGGAMNDFDLLQELADRLHGAVSASRMAVDNGKADRMIQVGQSGRFVRPRLYIAEGIYGALQHVAGMKKAEHVIAVNTDPYAPICSLADIVVEADAADFTRRLIKRIDKEKNKQVQ